MEAADFTLRTLDDREITLARLKESPGTLLVFWATWSPKSESALREAQALHERHAGVGTAGGGREPRPARHRSPGARPHREERRASLGLTMPVALDPGFAACSSIGVVANPSFALFDCARRARLGRGGVVAVGAGVAPRAGRGPARAARAGGRRRVKGPPSRAQGPAELQSRADLPPAGQPGEGAHRCSSRRRRPTRPGRRRGRLLGYLLLQQAGGRGLAQAEAFFRAAVDIDPGDVVGAHRPRRDAAAGGPGRRGRAVSGEGLASSTRPSPPRSRASARVLARQGRPAEALALFAAALELNPRDAAILAGRAECREANGNLAEATTDYRQALEILLGAR